MLIGLLLLPFVSRLEKISYDIRMRTVARFHAKSVSRNVVVIAINEKTILSKKPFVFWYPDLGRFCSLMASMNAKVLGLDLIPIHSLEVKLGSPYLDASQSGNRPFDFKEMGKVFDDQLLSGIMEAAGSSRIVQGVSGSVVPFYYDVLAFMDNVTPASLKLQPDADSVVRSQSGRDNDGVSSFPAEMLKVSGYHIPFPDHLAINYSVLADIPVYDFEAVTTGRVAAALIKNKIAILGLLSPYDDVHETPIGTKPGMLIHATSIETVLSGKTIEQCQKPLSLLLLLLVCVVSFPLSVLGSPVRSVLSLAMLTCLYVLTTFVFFYYGMVVPLFPHAVMPVIMFGITYPYLFVLEGRGKRKLYQAFSYYVSSEVIDRLITSDAEHLMKGERHNVCIMFLDIRGFTALSEKYESEAIVAMLNLFFEQVTLVIQKHGGFVNKFIGDGMLAFFTPGEECVDNAIEASIEICRVTSEINSSGILQQYIGDDLLAIGIGLHAGSVILGNIGSRHKMDFTVIGRAVNAASRIESLTKEYSRSILLSSEIKSMSRKGFDFEPLGVVSVKGIAGGVELFGLKL